MKIIIGLGNPGKKYELTRHNAGFMAVEAMAERLNLSWENNKKFNSLICKDRDTLLVKPQTFMNNSGQAVQAILSYYKLLPKKSLLPSWLGGDGGGQNSDLANILTVIHDDIDIELGKFKISIDSRSAGHKGIESIINHLKTKNFKRVRIGINNNKPAQMPTEKYVLQKFSEEKLEIIKNIISVISQEALAQ
ncbi:MAG: aminoacyl-tRNA hydrolase [Candidatus Helarchaeota archaeon]